MVSLKHSTQNDTRFADLLKDVRKLGGDTAEGRDAKARLAIRVVRAASDGVITLDVETDAATGKPLPDAAYQIYDEYLKADSKKAVYEHSKGGIKKEASLLRTLIRFGSLTTVDAVDVLNRAVTIHGNLDVKERLSAYPAFVEVAKAQLADGQTDDALTDGQLEQACRKAEGEPKGQAAFIKAAAKALEKAQSAEDADPALTDRLQAALAEVGACLAYLDSKGKRAALMAQLAALDAAA